MPFALPLPLLASPTAPAREVQTGKRTRTKPQPPYHVVLLDDDDHTYEYVVEMLGKLFGHSRPKAFAMACEVDATGRVIVWTGPLERAEAKRDAIHGYGADWRLPRSAGSMSAVVEAAKG